MKHSQPHMTFYQEVIPSYYLSAIFSFLGLLGSEAEGTVSVVTEKTTDSYASSSTISSYSKSVKDQTSKACYSDSTIPISFDIGVGAGANHSNNEDKNNNTIFFILL